MQPLSTLNNRNYFLQFFKAWYEYYDRNIAVRRYFQILKNGQVIKLITFFYFRERLSWSFKRVVTETFFIDLTPNKSPKLVYPNNLKFLYVIHLQRGVRFLWYLDLLNFYRCLKLILFQQKRQFWKNRTSRWR